MTTHGETKTPVDRDGRGALSDAHAPADLPRLHWHEGRQGPQQSQDGGGAEERGEGNRGSTTKAAQTAVRWLLSGVLLLIAVRAQAQALTVSTIATAAGSVVSVPVSFVGNDAGLVAVEADFLFPDGVVPLSLEDGTPDCIANPAHPHRGFFGFLPYGCTPSVDCTGVRMVIVGFGETIHDPVHDGWIARCRAAVGADAPSDTLPVTCPQASGAVFQYPGTPPQVEIPCSAGAIIVDAPMCAGDMNGDGRVMVPELVTAVNNSLMGCP